MDGEATVFPQAVGLGATWNDELLHRIGTSVSAEARAMRRRDDRVGLNVWAPVVNLLRNPLWGRNEEGYAEDPHLTAAIATAYTRGLRGDHPEYWRTAPVLKHWLAHNNETDRDTSNASVRPRVLHEYDLRAFKRPVEAGAVAGVMPAYNLVNRRPNHVSPYLREQLRTWTDQDLLVCSDAGAPSNLVDSEHYFATHEEAVAAALRAGVDSFTDHGTDSSTIVGRLRRAYDQGLISEADIDAAVRRQLEVRARLGEFADTAPFDQDQDQDWAFDTDAHRALAQEAAEQAIVLLKNDGLLPLAEHTRIAVVGLLADECKTDWYSGTLIRRSTPLDGLRERFGAENVTYAEGVDRVRLRCAEGWVCVPETRDEPAPEASGVALDPALIAGRTDLPPLHVSPSAEEAAELALVDWGSGVRTLRAPDGRYLSVADDGHVRASAERPGGWVVQETYTLEPHGNGHLLRHAGTGRYVSVAADGLKVADQGTVFEVDVVERGADAVARAAADADVVLVFAGNDPHINGRETEDRATLELPPQQVELWRAARATNPRTALALVSSYPYAVPDAGAELPALLWAAHGGQAAGRALARVLAGDVSPAGRLPQTWYAADTDLPGLLDYDIIGSRQTYLYFEGAPLYPFGHGLSYARFTYDALFVSCPDDMTVEVTFTVTNTARARPTRCRSCICGRWTPPCRARAGNSSGTAASPSAPGRRSGSPSAFRSPSSATGTSRVAAGASPRERTNCSSALPARTSASPKPCAWTATHPLRAPCSPAGWRRRRTTSSAATSRSSTARRHAATPLPVQVNSFTGNATSGRKVSRRCASTSRARGSWTCASMSPEKGPWTSPTVLVSRCPRPADRTTTSPSMPPSLRPGCAICASGWAAASAWRASTSPSGGPVREGVGRG